MTEKEKQEKELVVTELPSQQVRTVIGENGEAYKLITINEAIQEILESVRELKRLVG
jgi:hypothetical protein